METFDCANEDWMLFDCTPPRAPFIMYIFMGLMGFLAMASEKVALPWLLLPITAIAASIYFLVRCRGVLLDRKANTATEWAEFYKWRVYEREYPLSSYASVNIHSCGTQNGSEYFTLSLYGDPDLDLVVTPDRDSAVSLKKRINDFLQASTHPVQLKLADMLVYDSKENRWKVDLFGAY